MGVAPHLTRERAGQSASMYCAHPDLVHVFARDPDLLEGVDEPTAATLRAQIVTRRVHVDAGSWQPAWSDEEVAGHLGLLVIDGVLVRTLRLVGRECSEIVGPGDLIRPWDCDAPYESVPGASHWRALQATTLASLDARFALRIARWPTIASALLARGTQRCTSLVHQATIAHVRSADARVLLVLWHLADRWGRVTPDGILVPVPLTHQLLAQLTCLQRPTVSSAVGQLSQQGQLTRLSERGWLLHGEPPTSGLALPRRLAAA
jgi:CRP/FNR family cyclic AMP-dependent transcriptional regulator